MDPIRLSAWTLLRIEMQDATLAWETSFGEHMYMQHSQRQDPFEDAAEQPGGKYAVRSLRGLARSSTARLQYRY